VEHPGGVERATNYSSYVIIRLVTAMASLTLACVSPTAYLALASSAVPARSSLSSASVRHRLSCTLLLKQPRISFSAALFLQNLVFTSGIPLRCMLATPALSHSRAKRVSTLVHPSDLCTKALPPRQFERLRGHILGSQRVSNEVSASSDSMDI
jgi:hypothetical protein